MKLNTAFGVATVVAGVAAIIFAISIMATYEVTPLIGFSSLIAVVFSVIAVAVVAAVAGRRRSTAERRLEEIVARLDAVDDSLVSMTEGAEEKHVRLESDIKALYERTYGTKDSIHSLADRLSATREDIQALYERTIAMKEDIQALSSAIQTLSKDNQALYERTAQTRDDGIAAHQEFHGRIEEVERQIEQMQLRANDPGAHRGIGPGLELTLAKTTKRFRERLEARTESDKL